MESQMFTESNTDTGSGGSSVFIGSERPLPMASTSTLLPAGNGLVPSGQAQKLGSARVSDRISPCQCCGGRGVLRVSNTGFRTCLACIGQGRLPVIETSSAYQAKPELSSAVEGLVYSTRGRTISVSDASAAR